MEQIKDVLPKNKWQNDKIKFLNFGLGLMREEERELLLEIGAIKHIQGIDFIALDGCCVNVYHNSEANCVFKGNEMECKLEAEKIKKEKPSIDVKVMFYPKSYYEYYAKEQARRKAIDLEEEYNEHLLKEIGFN